MANPVLSLLNSAKQQSSGLKLAPPPKAFTQPIVQPQARTVPDDLKQQIVQDYYVKALMNSNTPGNLSNYGPLSEGLVGTSKNAPAVVPPNLSSAISDLESRKLKYSQDRGPGCTDCSAAVDTIYRKAYGKSPGITTKDQRAKGKWITNPSVGDLIHFDSTKKKDSRHVGIYLGDGNMWHFSINGPQTVKLSDYIATAPNKLVGYTTYR